MQEEIYYGPRPLREMRGVYDEETIRVYQAFGPDIAFSALEAQTFVEPFKFVLSWASWIKPSFLWTMGRTRWARYTRIGNKGGQPEHEGEAFILAVDVKRNFFDQILSVARMTHYPRGYDKKKWKQYMKSAEAYVQWDPEKDISGAKRPWKAIQIGLKTPVLRDYADSIVSVSDMGPVIREILETKDRKKKVALLPDEKPYPVNDAVIANLEMIK